MSRAIFKPAGPWRPVHIPDLRDEAAHAISALERQNALLSANAYIRRCRDMLSIVLGTRPSAETEAIRQTLQ